MSEFDEKRKLIELPEPNTFIGAAGATLNTKALLAARYSGITEDDIYNFRIDANNNISCYIHSPYAFNDSAFRDSSIPGITYYLDIDGKATLQSFDIPDGEANLFRGNMNNVIVLPEFKQLSYNTFALGSYDLISMPRCIPIGRSDASDSVFLSTTFTGNVYVNIANQTNNSGSPDGDIHSGVLPWVKYSSNSNRPQEPENIRIKEATDTYIDIEWDAVAHTNSIDYYLIFVDGNYKGKTQVTSFRISGLTEDTEYSVKILVIDSMGNNSSFDNLNLFSTSMPLSAIKLEYLPSTQLELMIETINYEDFYIDWGDGIVEQYPSETTVYKNYSSPTSGIVTIYGATTGNTLKWIESTQGNWNFDISALSTITERIHFYGDSMQIYGDISSVSNTTRSVSFSGKLMTIYGNIFAFSNIMESVELIGNAMSIYGDLSSCSKAQIIYFIGSLMELTYTSNGWTSDIKELELSLAPGRLTSNEIDNLLVDIDMAAQNAWGTIMLQDENGTPTSIGLAAKNSLINKGKTVYTN